MAQLPKVMKTGESEPQFHLFPDLPAELRQKIWEYAVLDIQGVVLDAEDLKPYREDDFRDDGICVAQETTIYHSWLNNEGQKNTKARNSDGYPRYIPDMVEAFPEARVAAKLAGLLRDDLIPGQTVWFNPSQDALFFRPSLLISWLEKGIPPNHQLRAAHLDVEKVVATRTSFSCGDAFIVLADARFFPNFRSILMLSDPILCLEQAVLVSYRKPNSSQSDAGVVDHLLFLPELTQSGEPSGAVTRGSAAGDIDGAMAFLEVLQYREDDHSDLFLETAKSSAFEDFWMSRRQACLDPSIDERDSGIYRETLRYSIRWSSLRSRLDDGIHNYQLPVLEPASHYISPQIAEEMRGGYKLKILSW